MQRKIVVRSFQWSFVVVVVVILVFLVVAVAVDIIKTRVSLFHTIVTFWYGLRMFSNVYNSETGW